MISLSKITKLPDAPGVYFFKDARGKILYVGKATSLKNRVRSYFKEDLVETRGLLLTKMMEHATKVDFLQTDSVLEALIMEASLIQKYKPFHNTLGKDDKSYNFVLITKETFPRVLVIRGREIQQKYTDPNSYTALFGPFPNGGSLRIAMRIIRRIFPYRDKCVSVDQIPAGKPAQPCFNSQIGLCPGVCAGTISAKEYGRTIKHLMMFFEGRKKALLASLEKDMKKFAAQKEFEKADAVKKTVFALQHIQDVALIHKDKVVGTDGVRAENRIEAYDIAHLSGTSTVGVMVVVEDGEPNPAEYRMFKIRQAGKGDDLKSLEEVLNRRFNHPEWQFPSLIVIDGGQTHLNYAREVLKKLHVEVPVVSVVKDEKHNPKDVLGGEAHSGMIEKNREGILHANSEAHRFAITYHKKVRNKSFLGGTKLV